MGAFLLLYESKCIGLISDKVTRDIRVLVPLVQENLLVLDINKIGR